MTMHPADRFLEALRDRGLTTGPGCRVESGRVQMKARCPHHSDARASLSFKREEDRVLLKCWAGCRPGDILKALGLTWRELHVYPPGAPRPVPIVVARYQYVSLAGELVAEKQRFSNKTFRWRRPGARAGSWVWNLDGATPGLYPLPDLRGCSQVFVCEGEKSVDLLWSLGLPATCGPSGAATWAAQWSRDLVSVGAREIVILPDNDGPGDRHAERVASVTFAEAPTGTVIKVLNLPDLPRGGDVFDWLAGSHAASDLLALVATTPRWAPGAKDRARLERKRTKARERQQRLRERRRIRVISPDAAIATGRVLEYRPRERAHA